MRLPSGTNHISEANTEAMKKKNEERLRRRNYLKMQQIQRIMKTPRHERTQAQIQTLVKYLKTVKVFKDLLLDGKGSDKSSSRAAGDDQASFEHLASCMKVEQINESGHILMEEGGTGDLFYIILEGEC